MDTGRRRNRKDTGRRIRSRVQSQFDAELVCGVRRIPVSTENVSLKGMLVRARDESGGQLPDTCLLDAVGCTCTLRLQLAKGILIEVDAQVVRVDEGLAALAFAGMDSDSYTHLRNIVRFASPDADNIDREQFNPAFEDDEDDDDWG